MKIKDMAGQRFGRLLVLAPAGILYAGRSRRAAWWCICQCEREIIVDGGHLRDGNTTSCGCRGADRQPGRPVVSTKHLKGFQHVE
jgi:hypothetical protein